MKPKKVSDILQDALSLKQEESLRNEDWEKIWAQVCHEARPFSYVSCFKDGQLFVTVKNSAWLMELKKRKQEIIKLLEDKTGKKIKDIKFCRW